LEESIGRIQKGEDCTVGAYIKDICQNETDRSGQKVIFEEQQFDQPTNFELCIAIETSGKNLSEVLKTYGMVAVFFKDNPSIDIGEWKWHGASSDKIYLEPIIRHIDIEKKKVRDGTYFFELLFRTEIRLNSQKSTEFKRVEKRDIRGYVKK
jgi:hypothetical protein